MISLSDKTRSLYHITRSLFSSTTFTLLTDRTSELRTVYLTVFETGEVGIEACMLVVVTSQAYCEVFTEQNVSAVVFLLYV